MSYTVAKYLRFSVDDGNTADSESVKNQRDLLNLFISEREDFRGCTLLEFTDDGYTGMNFQRPGFKSMIEAVKAKKIDCIIVKDLSRFGRNYIDVSDYLDQIFPFLGVRFIAINNNYDSKGMTATLGLDMSMTNFIHDLYSRDLSKKIKSARKTLMKKGEYIAPFAFYGYKKSVKVKKQLIVDPHAAEIVKRIFEYAADGIKAREIAMRLSNDRVLPPNEYAKRNSTGKKHYIPMESVPLWIPDIIRKIIKDERYTGKMVCNKYTTVKRKVYNVPKDEWIVTPNTHEAIVSDEIWNRAQAIFRTRKEIIMPTEPKSVLTGVLVCGYCKKKLVMESRQKLNTPFFYCHNYNMGLGCEKAKINEYLLKETVYTAIRKQIELVQATEQSVFADKQAKADERNAKKRGLEMRLKNLKLSQETALEKYLEEQITKNEYQAVKKETTELTKEVTQQLNALNELSADMTEYMERHKPFYNSEELTREMVKTLIKEIKVYSAESIEIVWAFTELYQKLRSLLSA